MKIKFRKPYRGWKPGETADIASGIAKTLVSSGKAEFVETKVVTRDRVQNKAVTNDAR